MGFGTSEAWGSLAPDPFFDNTGGSIVDAPMRISRLEIAMGFAADYAAMVTAGFMVDQRL